MKNSKWVELNNCYRSKKAPGSSRKQLNEEVDKFLKSPEGLKLSRDFDIFRASIAANEAEAEVRKRTKSQTL